MEERRMSDLLAVFFDLDNTLIATRKADEITCNKLKDILIQKYSIPPKVAGHICKKYLEIFRRCPDNNFLDLHTWRQQLWTQALGEHYKTLTEPIYQQWLYLRYEHLTLPKETKQLLRSLRENHLVGLITNGPSNAQWEKVDKLNLKFYFDVILVSGDLPYKKPHHGIFHEACEILGVKPQQSIMIGDKLETDILGGMVANFAATAWIPLGSRTLRVDDPVPNYILENVVDLYNLVPHIQNNLKHTESGEMMNSESNVSLLDIDDCNSNESIGS